VQQELALSTPMVQHTKQSHVDITHMAQSTNQLVGELPGKKIRGTGHFMQETIRCPSAGATNPLRDEFDSFLQH
jgi:hypothetical protein